MGLISQLFYFYYISYKIEYNFMIYLDNTTEGQIIFIPRNDQKIEEIKPIPEDILGDYYTKKQADNKFATKTELNSVNELNEIEVITLLNFQITQEQVNYLCENYGTKNIVLKGQFEDEDTFEWLDLIKFRVYGKEDDGNWLAMIGVADGVYRYFFDAEKVFNENDELVWQISREVEDIYKPTVKDVLINDLSTLDGKFRNIEVLLDYGNVVNILNGTQTIYVLNTKEEVINGTIMTYIFGIGSNSNNDLVKYMWKRQNGNIIYSSEVIGGGSNDIVYFDFDIEDGEFNKNDDFNFKTVAQALKENKIVYVNGNLVSSYYITDDLIGYISIVSNNSVNMYDAIFTDYLHNTISVTSQWFTIPNEEEMIYITDELYNLNERVTELENGGTGGGSSNVYTIAKSQLSQEKIPEIVTAFENGEVIIMGNNSPNTKLYGKVISYGGTSLTTDSKSLKLLVAWYYSVLPTNRNVTFKEILINADGVEEFDVNITDLKNRIETLENNGGGSPTYVVGLETVTSMDATKFNEIANEYVNESKEVQIFWANNDGSFTTVDVIEVKVDYRDDETYYGVISALNDKWECDINGNVTYTEIYYDGILQDLRKDLEDLSAEEEDDINKVNAQIKNLQDQIDAILLRLQNNNIN